jgi:5-methyltetrahydrofolate--homocysteine methyltransferase
LAAVDPELAAQEFGAPCIIASLAYDRLVDGSGYKTMMGMCPERAVEFLSDIGVDILALNCGTGVDMAAATSIVSDYNEFANCLTMAQPNAGLPVLEKMKAVYKQSPEEMVASLGPLLESGVNIVGGCCGSTPDHIRAIRQQVDIWNARRR